MSSRLLQVAGRSLSLSSKRPMHQNPFINRYKDKMAQVDPKHFKQTTGLTGLWVDETPHHSLKVAYGRILRVLEQMPQDAVYRRFTEQIVKQRLALVNSEPDIPKLEEKIGMGQIEEVVEQAEYELETAINMLEHKVWEPLVGPAPKGQWDWPI
ncbi:hypothetical protein WR25_10097 [Diploscapter pachys]|uniref:NADH dehydrogenase [ubiquinone] 1 alpha subcomplex subunit 5 n=1 Tax=Diploscapter pachys TaxID=2018661 RepID=A0A2A2JID3_9BILA|nr:hypothetical protein WR25_10097 [Diploscapter pachys]